MVRTMRNFKTAVTREHPSRTFGSLRVATMNTAPTKETATANKGLIDSISMAEPPYATRQPLIYSSPALAQLYPSLFAFSAASSFILRYRPCVIDHDQPSSTLKTASECGL